MTKKWRDPLFLQDIGVAIVVLAAAGGIIGGWIALLKQFGAL